MSKNSKNRTLIEKLRYKYRLIIINEDTFEQKASLRLSRFNLYTLFSLLTMLLVVATISLIAFTPVKYYLPGVGSLDVRSKLVNLEYQTDSLQEEINRRNFWISNFQTIVSGDFDSSFYMVDSSQQISIADIDLNNVTDEELELREEMEEEEALAASNVDNLGGTSSIVENKTVQTPIWLIAPVDGIVTDNFSLAEGHMGIDIAAKQNAPVKSIYSGTVIVSEWNPETGKVIAIQHPNGIISFYKHNEVLLKKVGNFVSKGEVVALVGNSGSLSTGPHLHFELWQDGRAVDPLKYFYLDQLN